MVRGRSGGEWVGRKEVDRGADECAVEEAEGVRGGLPHPLRRQRQPRTSGPPRRQPTPSPPPSPLARFLLIQIVLFPSRRREGGREDAYVALVLAAAAHGQAVPGRPPSLYLNSHQAHGFGGRRGDSSMAMFSV